MCHWRYRNSVCGAEGSSVFCLTSPSRGREVWWCGGVQYMCVSAGHVWTWWPSRHHWLQHMERERSGDNGQTDGAPGAWSPAGGWMEIWSVIAPPHIVSVMERGGGGGTVGLRPALLLSWMTESWEWGVRGSTRAQLMLSRRSDTAGH